MAGFEPSACESSFLLSTPKAPYTLNAFWKKLLLIKNINKYRIIKLKNVSVKIYNEICTLINIFIKLRD